LLFSKYPQFLTSYSIDELLKWDMHFLIINVVFSTILNGNHSLPAERYST
jgi:hypothetical protein